MRSHVVVARVDEATWLWLQHERERRRAAGKPVSLSALVAEVLGAKRP